MGKNIYNKEPDGSSQVIAEIRGWGAIQHLFKTKEEAEQFQDEVGKFIVEAIREKIERLNQQEISDKEIQSEAIKRSSKYQDSNLFENTWEEAIEWYKEKLQSLKQSKTNKY